MVLAGALVLLPLPTSAALDLWACAATERLLCNAGEACTAAAPEIAQMRIMPVTGRIEFCVGEQCYEGVMELEREGWPEYRRLGTAHVEALPLPRVYRGDGIGYFAAFDEAARRFALSSLRPGGQEVTWFDCSPWGE